MKYFFTVIVVLSAVFFSFVSVAPASAQSLQQEINTQGRALAVEARYDPSGSGTPLVVAARIIKLFLSFVGILTVAYTIYGGFLIMTSAGVEEKITKGKSIIKWGVVGVGVTLSAWGISWLVAYIAFSAQNNPFAPRTRFFVQPDEQRLQNPDRLEQDTVPFVPY